MQPPIYSALVLMGGGARAAYQVGVLKGMNGILKEAGYADDLDTFFKVYCGTSAGSLNAAQLACYADDPDAGLRSLETLWCSLTITKIFYTNWMEVVKASVRWLARILLSYFGWRKALAWVRAPRSILNNAPLRHLLTSNVAFSRLPSLYQSQKLHALAISAYSYSSGRHFVFVQGDVSPWKNVHQDVIADTLMVDHLMASTAIPLIFPAIRLKTGEGFEYFGDGALAQRAPLSAAIHLGGRYLVVINCNEPEKAATKAPKVNEYPSFAVMSAHMLSGMFNDSIVMDLANMQKINDLIAAGIPRNEQKLQPVTALMFTPSTSLNVLANECLESLPKSLRILFSALGGKTKSVHSGKEGASERNFASYLLFQPRFIQKLITLGESDAKQQKEVVLAFFAKLKVEKTALTR